MNAKSVLGCNGMGISRLENIPASLHTLYCGGNQITRLENLPASLHTLYCRYNQLTRLENLPASLQTLDCSRNTIEYMDGLEFNRFSKTRDFFKCYTIIRRFQIRWRIARRCKR